MPKCGDFDCTEDTITLDEIESPCISAGKNLCTSCKNIEMLRAQNVIAFNDNPLHKIFGISNPSKKYTKDFWKLLHEKCGITIPSAKKTKNIQIVEPDFKMLLESSTKISNRFLRDKQHDHKEHVRYLLGLQSMANLAQGWNLQLKFIPAKSIERFEVTMKQDILDIVQKYKLRIGGSHYPREIPLAAALYLNALGTSNLKKFRKSLDFLTKQSGCLEGVLQLSMDILVKS